MTDYAIGDIQGCYEPLRRVLDKAGFSPSRDRLWSVGDLVNRGPASLEALRYMESLGNSAVVVLGNHDLHLLAVALGGHSLKNKDTLAEILEAPDRAQLLDWLCRQKLMVHDPDRNLVMAHAGLPHIWSVDRALGYAREVEQMLCGPEPEVRRYFEGMYGNKPDRWDDKLEGMDRLRAITNYLTRMRFIAEDGTLEFASKETVDDAPDGFAPWFRFPRSDDVRVVFGHWAALGGQTNSERFTGLDTGCVWGNRITLMNLDTREKIGCDCA